MEKTLKILLEEERQKVIKEVESFCPLADIEEQIKQIVPSNSRCQCPYHELSEQLHLRMTSPKYK